jgi:hypothetical protein
MEQRERQRQDSERIIVWSLMGLCAVLFITLVYSFIHELIK